MLEKIEEFECHLNGTSFSANTIRSYLASVRQYQEEYEKLSLKNLKSYRQSLIARYRPKTVNLRIRGINLYLDFIGRGKWRQSFVKEQQSTFLENVISEADYDYLKSCLIQDKEYSWYFVVRFLGATGARISELLQLKVENVRAGHLDLYTKGGKFRRIYVPRALQADALTWLEWERRGTGFVFLNQRGQRITSRGISAQLKKFAERYNIDPAVVYPHSFRHRFAKSFLERCNDIAFLADLMGHDNIETTRVYLRKTSMEQRKIVDEVVEW